MANKRTKKRRRRYRPRLTSNRLYGARDAALRELGFNSYSDYLASHLWRDVRASLLRERQWVCQLCAGTATQVHHQRYYLEDLTGARFDYLVAVCRDCHWVVEFDAAGKKRSGPAAVRQCRCMMKKLKRGL